MKKDEFVQVIADSADLTKADAERVLTAIINTIVDSVASGERIKISGLGTFEPRQRSAREGRNPQTGETMQIAATTTPGFKPATAFKQAVGRA